MNAETFTMPIHVEFAHPQRCCWRNWVARYASTFNPDVAMLSNLSSTIFDQDPKS